MTPISQGIKDICTNFTPYFARNQGKFAPKYLPYFYHFEDAFSFHPLITRNQGHFSEINTPIFTISKTLLNFPPISRGNEDNNENCSGKTRPKVLEIHPIFHFKDNFAPKHP